MDVNLTTDALPEAVSVVVTQPNNTLLLALVVAALVLGLITLIAVFSLMGKLKASRNESAGFAGSLAPAAPSFAGIDPAVVAAITAAIVADAPAGSGLVVRNIRRGSAWSDAGRRESLNY